jgi:hypothetical protein
MSTEDDKKVDDKIRITPHFPTVDEPRMGATCLTCGRKWDLGEAALSLRDVKRETRHQCSATTDVQREWPAVKEATTMTDPESVKKALNEAKIFVRKSV